MQRTRLATATKGGGSSTMNYQQTLQKMVESLAPGGTVEVARMKETEEAGRRLGAQLEGSAVSRGLGNVTLGNERIVSEHVAGLQNQVRANTLGQYINTLQFLAQLQFQGEENALNRSVNAARQGTPGLDAFGVPMPGSVQQQQLNIANRKLDLMSKDAAPSAEQFPSLFASGGYGGTDSYPEVPSLFGDMGGAEPKPESDYFQKMAEMFPAGSEAFTPEGTGTYTGGSKGSVLTGKQVKYF